MSQAADVSPERLAELLVRCYLEVEAGLPIDLDTLCGGDPELRARVERLLRQLER